MSVSRPKSIWHTLLYSRITLVFALCLSLALAFSVYERYTIEREMAERLRSAEAELEELRNRKQEIESKVEYLSADHGIEAEIRKHFDVAREGEQVIVIVPAEGERETKDTTVILDTPHKSSSGFWSRLFPW